MTNQKGHINLIAPATSGKDITQILPLWAGVLPDDQTREIFENVLLDPDRFWSPYWDSVLSLILETQLCTSSGICSLGNLY